MLHILLLILKIIGIIFAVVLGIILLLVGIILFVPIRYEIAAKCDGTIESLRAKVKATWLLHLLRVEVLVKGKKLKWQVKAAWIKKTNALVFGERKEEPKDEAKEEQKTEIPEEKSESTSETIAETVKEDRLEETSKEFEKKSESIPETGETISEEGEKKSISDKIKENIEKIKTKINDLLCKKEKITDFLTDKSHVNAFNKIKKELLILLRKLKPKKINIKLRFGFDDPATTGKVLGGLAMLYPFLGDTTEIIPDFEHQILKGNIFIKGKIRISQFASLAIKLLLCKDVRKSYKDIKNFKL